MRRRRLGPWESSALGVSLVIAVAASCNVYDESLLTGGSSGKGGSSAGGEGGEGATGGTAGSSGGTQGGGTSGASGKGGSAGGGGTDTGGTGTGGSGGSTGGTATGGTATGGDGGDPGTGGDAGSVTGGKAGSASGGSAGSGGSGGSGPTGGTGGTAGSGGACGKCGCGMPETDTDTDGVPDCIDMCMGVSDADCAVLKSGLVHRYSFGGTGTAVTDTKGTAHGTAVNATLSGTGTLSLAGGNSAAPPYVNLPNGLVSSLTNATFEFWITWNQSGTTGQNWQRIFDFGTSGTEDAQTGSSTTTMSYLFLTTRAGTAPTVMRAAFTTSGPATEIVVNAPAALATGTRQQVAVVIDDQNDDMALYLNGVRQTSVLFSGQLSLIADVNNWLGRSQYSPDYELIGIYDEFRIYNVALTAAQLRTSTTAGPNPTFL